MLGRLRACYLDSCVLKTQLGDRVEGGAGVTKRFVTWKALYLGPSLEMENFGILEGGAGVNEHVLPGQLCTWVPAWRWRTLVSWRVVPERLSAPPQTACWSPCSR